MALALIPASPLIVRSGCYLSVVNLDCAWREAERMSGMIFVNLSDADLAAAKGVELKEVN